MLRDVLKVSAGVRLDINRDSEVLNQFVLTSTFEEPAEDVECDQKDPLKRLSSSTNLHKHDGSKGTKDRGRRIKERKKVEFDKTVSSLPPTSEKQKSIEEQRDEKSSKEGKIKDESDVDKSGEKVCPRALSASKQEKSGIKMSQKQMKEELSKRRKKRKRPKPEEVYTDKDRAAAVNMGTRDIKQSLRIKRRQDRSRLLQIGEEANTSTYLALGNSELIRRGPTIALPFYNKALELNPTEKHSLVARSKCFLLLGRPEDALKDAEVALVADKNFVKAIYQKAEALYYLGDFEHSLMYYHRGLKMRPEHEGFQLGIRKAQKAIENAVGGSFIDVRKRTTSRSRAEGENKTPETVISFATVRAATGESNENSKKSDSAVGSATSSSAEESNDLPASSNSRGMMSRTALRPKTGVKKGSSLLRELKVDKEYLDSLLKHPDLKCRNKEDNSELIGYVQEAVDFLNKRQEFWRQQLPQNSK